MTSKNLIDIHQNHKLIIDSDIVCVVDFKSHFVNIILLNLKVTCTSHEKLDQHFTELANVLIFTALLLSTTNMTLSCIILRLILIKIQIRPGSVIMRFKVYCFELLLQDAAQVRSAWGRIFSKCTGSVATQNIAEFGQPL